MDRRGGMVLQGHAHMGGTSREGVSGGTNLITKHEGKIHSAQVTWDNTTG